MLEGMQELFSSPGMITVLVIVLIVEALSLLLLLVILQVFRTQAGKYRMLLTNMGNQEAWGRPGKYIIPFYVATTLGFTAATTAIFIFQPHLL